MGQINTTKLPDYVPNAQQAATKVRTSSDAASAGSVSLPPTSSPQDDLQLTKLSGVLNSLKKGANAMRSQLVQVMTAVRSGTYEVDSLQVSRSIVGESLSSR